MTVVLPTSLLSVTIHLYIRTFIMYTQFVLGPVAIIAPFNFPLEIPILQIMGALYMGNKARCVFVCEIKSDERPTTNAITPHACVSSNLTKTPDMLHPSTAGGVQGRPQGVGGDGAGHPHAPRLRPPEGGPRLHQRAGPRHAGAPGAGPAAHDAVHRWVGGDGMELWTGGSRVWMHIAWINNVNKIHTGSSRVAEALATLLHGKIKIEDAGFDWKVRIVRSSSMMFAYHPLRRPPTQIFNTEKTQQVLGPDVKEFDYVAWTADQDAYAYSGQKCSAQSILFAHENWVKAGIEGRLKVRGVVYLTYPPSPAEFTAFDLINCHPHFTKTGVGGPAEAGGPDGGARADRDEPALRAAPGRAAPDPRCELLMKWGVFMLCYGVLVDNPPFFV